MPRVQVRQLDYQDPGRHIAAGIAEAGKALGAGFLKRSEMKAHQQEVADKLEVEKSEAATRLLREQNRAAERQQLQDERAKDRQASVQGLLELRDKAAGQAAVTGFRKALESPEGVLGPFGIASKAAMAAGGAAAKTMARLQPKIALAGEMTPAGARQFLAQTRKEELQTAVSEGYGEELKMLEQAVAEGRIGKDKAQLYAKALQESIATGKSPGAIRQRIIQEYDNHAKLTARMEGWEKADTQAGELLSSMRQLVASVPDTVDTMTGKSMRDVMIQRLAKANVEWNRTKPGEEGVSQYRTEHDPAQSLAALQAIVWGAEAVAAPGAYAEREALDARLTQQGAMISPETGALLGRMQPNEGFAEAPDNSQRQMAPARQAAQDAPGAKQPAGRVAGTPAGRSPKGGPGGRTPEATLRGVVRDGAQKALEAGKDTKAAMKELLADVARTTGMSPTSPEVLAIVRDELEKVKRGQPGPEQKRRR